jgi:hypothetical protein
MDARNRKLIPIIYSDFNNQLRRVKTLLNIGFIPIKSPGNTTFRTPTKGMAKVLNSAEIRLICICKNAL